MVKPDRTGMYCGSWGVLGLFTSNPAVFSERTVGTGAGGPPPPNADNISVSVTEPRRGSLTWL